MSNPEEYYLPEYVRFVRLNDDRAVLSGPINKHIMEGKSVDLVAESVPHLRDGITVEQLADELGVSHSSTTQLLTHLLETNLVRQKEAVGDDVVEWVSSQPNEAQNELVNTTVAVLLGETISTTPPKSFHSLVDVHRIETIASLSDLQEPPEILLTFAIGASPEFHQTVLKKTWSSNISWLPIRLVDSEIRLGPYTTPDIGPCYNCYYQRLVASASDMDMKVQEHRQGEKSRGHLFPSALDSLVWSLTELEVVSIVAPDRIPHTDGSVVTFDPVRMESATSDVLKLPGCEVCGTN